MKAYLVYRTASILRTCQKQKMSDKKVIQRVVAGGVIVSDGKVLILQRHSRESTYPDMWELPSGRRGYLEPTEQCLIREVREEAGLSVRRAVPFSVFDYVIEKADEVRDSTQINFLVTVAEPPEVTLSAEHQNYAWAGPAELDSYNLTDETKKVIREAFELLPFFLD